MSAVRILNYICQEARRKVLSMVLNFGCRCSDVDSPLVPKHVGMCVQQTDL